MHYGRMSPHSQEWKYRYCFPKMHLNAFQNKQNTNKKSVSHIPNFHCLEVLPRSKQVVEIQLFGSNKDTLLQLIILRLE